MGKITRKSYKNISDDDIINEIIKIWNIFKIEYNDLWIDHMCYIFVRNVTDFIGKQRSMTSKAASTTASRIEGHHLIEAKEFFNEWRNCIENDEEFTVDDAKEWFRKAQNIFLTHEEHLITHSHEFKKYIEQHHSQSNMDILKHFDIEILDENI
jgi:hypothetical protein